jgi:transmembrane sensor
MSNRFLKQRFLSVIDRYLKGKSSAEEIKLVDYFYDSIEDEDDFNIKFNEVKSEIKSAIDESITDESCVQRKRNFTYLKVVASILLISASSFYFYRSYFSASVKNTISNVVDDGEEMPIIVLENGDSFRLRDSLKGKSSYKIIENERVFQLSDTILSNGSKKLSKVENPTNKIFAFLLQDGTTAWLNPNSSLELLPDENGKRMVRIEGTVLFNVQKIKNNETYKPFVVKTPLQTVEVLGTKFLLNATNSENENILLIEGKVKLTHNRFNTQVILNPDQKASLKRNEPNILITKSTETYKVEAWYRGLFYFENEKMVDVMREISLWYNKEIVVDNKIKNIPITGMISRYKTVDEVLQIIELTNNVNYKNQDEKIYVR